MLRAAFVSLVLVIAGCGRGGSSKPAGTSADPVETCERVGDVCRIDKAKLGVCATAQAGGGDLVCASQH